MNIKLFIFNIRKMKLFYTKEEAIIYFKNYVIDNNLTFLDGIIFKNDSKILRIVYRNGYFEYKGEIK